MVFLRTATEDDNLTELYSNTGDWLGLLAGDSITIGAKVGESDITPLTCTVSTDITTLNDLADELEAALGLSTEDSVYVDSDGSLQVHGESGTANAITNLSITSPGNSVLSTGFAFSETQEASDVKKSVSSIVYDSLGNTHNITITFMKTGIADRWTWTAETGDDEVVTGGASGTILFNEDGTLSAFSVSDGKPFSFEPGTGASPVEIDLFAGTSSKRDGITQFAGDSTVQTREQDGYGQGFISSISIDTDGIISGLFTNGITRNLAQIYVSEFNNPGGLEKVSDNLYAASLNSGDPRVEAAGPSGGTSISSGYLEMSNVDLATEFTNMIMTQRGYQANARIITTSDEMLVDAVSLKR
jgi:flagellar hook protein FlgE